MQRPSIVTVVVDPFTRRFLRLELPGLPADRLDAAVGFVNQRVRALASLTRFGVLAVGVVIRGLLALPLVGAQVPGVLRRIPLPLIGEYARLVRSLGLAYVFETWPDSRADGSSSRLTEALPAKDR